MATVVVDEKNHQNVDVDAAKGVVGRWASWHANEIVPLANLQ
jgi:hypothetical protein